VLTKWIIGDSTAAHVGRKGSDDEADGEKNSPYLLPKVMSSDEGSSLRDGVATSNDGLVGKALVILKQSLALRLGLIMFGLWFTNITYT